MIIEIFFCRFVEDDDDKWFTKLQTCKWLRYVSKALHGAASLAKLLNYKNIQLAGRKIFNEFFFKLIFLGSDIDNSCLMSSLIQILLRPKCRTIKGFCNLIVREWIIRGHPFRERFGQVISDSDKYPAQEVCFFFIILYLINLIVLFFCSHQYFFYFLIVFIN